MAQKIIQMQMRHLYFNLKDLFSNRKGFVILTSLLTHLKLQGQNIDPFMGSISFNPYRGQINHDLGHFL